ncbi:SpoIIE family protein phosphatase [Streptomyces sp. NPDC055955]|uniref:SpoIIE family protein phosphatase n=1 Tax=Streptomyces sp. NPDC055955 TaxID=3345665 RepID=UPI0035E0BED9
MLGLDETAPVPGLADFAEQVDGGSPPTLYGLLYDVLLRKRQSECLLRRSGPFERLVRMVAEPVRAKVRREARRQVERARALSEIADVLRDAVLPRLGAEVAPRVSTPPPCTGRRRAGIGGDWYKARKLPGGRLLITLGDGRGHGLDAVTLMAKLRYALAGLAYTGHPVEHLTEWVNLARP